MSSAEAEQQFAWEPGGQICAGVRQGAVLVVVEGDNGKLAVTMLPDTADAFAAHVVRCAAEARKEVLKEV